MSLTQRHKSATNVALETTFLFQYSQYSNFYQNQAQSPLCLTSFSLTCFFSLHLFLLFWELWASVRQKAASWWGEVCVRLCMCVFMREGQSCWGFFSWDCRAKRALTYRFNFSFCSFLSLSLSSTPPSTLPLSEPLRLSQCRPTAR